MYMTIYFPGLGVVFSATFSTSINSGGAKLVNGPKSPLLVTF